MTNINTEKDQLNRLIRIMGTFDLATGHADSWDDLFESLISELRHQRNCLKQALVGNKREWVGLTDKDRDKSWEWAQKGSPYGVTRIEVFSKSMEAKLKEKNHE